LLHYALPRYYAEFLIKFVSLEVEGMELLPKGRSIIVPNHSGIIGWDGIILPYEVFKITRRIPRIMTHAFWTENKYLKDSFQRLGFIPPDFKKAVKLLKKNKNLVIFPEAEHGNFKPSYKMYKLSEFNPGFVALAIMTNAVVVPTVIMGAEENFINLGTIDWFEKSLGAKIPIPLNLLPLPSKWKIKFLKPVSFAKYDRKDVKNEKFVKEVADNIRFRIQTSIQRELVTKGIFKF
jgi:1-acyl-sn-glycerol-3-phosphate acyltransferase